MYNSWLYWGCPLLIDHIIQFTAFITGFPVIHHMNWLLTSCVTSESSVFNAFQYSTTNYRTPTTWLSVHTTINKQDDISLDGVFRLTIMDTLCHKWSLSFAWHNPHSYSLYCSWGAMRRGRRTSLPSPCAPNQRFMFPTNKKAFKYDYLRDDVKSNLK